MTPDAYSFNGFQWCFGDHVCLYPDTTHGTAIGLPPQKDPQSTIPPQAVSRLAVPWDICYPLADVLFAHHEKNSQHLPTFVRHRPGPVFTFISSGLEGTTKRALPTHDP